MKVANPIYDVVFKYLLEDNKIAKLLISNLLGVEITNLELRPQEYSTDISKQTLTVYRVDFKAEIVLPNGDRTIVLIEIQKAKFTTDIMRFRKYLGEQYALKTNVVQTEKQTIPIPIITIYFLGYGLENNSNIPIIRVKRRYLDNFNGDELQGKELFVESLTHDSIIVQIPALKEKRRNDLEKALSVFEQSTTQEVSIKEEDYPVEYKGVIRRLLRAVSDDNIRKTMDMEDEVLENLARKERLLAKQEKALVEKEKELKQERQKAEQERQKAEQERQKAEQERQKAEQKDKELKKEHQKLIEAVKSLKKAGVSLEIIAQSLDLSIDDIQKL